MRSVFRTWASRSSSAKSCRSCTALGATVIANVWGDLEEDYVTVVRALEGAEGRGRDRVEHLLSQRAARRDALRQLAAADALARRPRTGSHEAAADRQALAQRARPRRVGAGGPRGRRRHPVAREHVRRHGDRSGNRAAADLLRHRRALRPRHPAARGADGLSGRARAAGCAADGHRRDRGALRTCSSSWRPARPRSRSAPPTSRTPASRAASSTSSPRTATAGRRRSPRSSAARSAPAKRAAKREPEG